MQFPATFTRLTPIDMLNLYRTVVAALNLNVSIRSLLGPSLEQRTLRLVCQSVVICTKYRVGRHYILQLKTMYLLKVLHYC